MTYVLSPNSLRLKVFFFGVIRVRIKDPRSWLRSWYIIKGTDESTLVTDSSVPLVHHDLSDLGSLILIQRIQRNAPLMDVRLRTDRVPFTPTSLINLLLSKSDDVSDTIANHPDAICDVSSMYTRDPCIPRNLRRHIRQVLAFGHFCVRNTAPSIFLNKGRKTTFLYMISKNKTKYYIKREKRFDNLFIVWELRFKKEQ